MNKPVSNLKDAFLEDHQKLIRGLDLLRQALQQGDEPRGGTIGR